MVSKQQWYNMDSYRKHSELYYSYADRHYVLPQSGIEYMRRSTYIDSGDDNDNLNSDTTQSNGVNYLYRDITYILFGGSHRRFGCYHLHLAAKQQ